MFPPLINCNHRGEPTNGFGSLGGGGGQIQWGFSQGELRGRYASNYALTPQSITQQQPGYNNSGYGMYVVLADPRAYTTHLKHATSIMTQALPLPPLEVLQDKFVYDSETGILARKNSGEPVGYPTQRGWLRVKVGNTHYRVHRIVWKMFYGEDPPVGLDIDHVNRIKTDNRITNLRLATRKENIANTPRVLNKVPKKRKTSEELQEIRRNAAKKTAEKVRKPIILISPSGGETWYPSITDAAKAENLLPPGISRVLTGLCKQHKGYTARYA